jgi:uncharacterized protein YkwD
LLKVGTVPPIAISIEKEGPMQAKNICRVLVIATVILSLAMLVGCKGGNACERSSEDIPTPDPGGGGGGGGGGSSGSDGELYCLELVNAERQKAGVSALQWDPQLAEIAKWFAQDKDDNDPTHAQKHYDSKGRLLNTRLADFGYTGYQTCGENINWGCGSGTAGAEKTMSEWMASSGHRSNILRAEFTHIGIGEVGGHWIQDFVRK